MNQKGDLNKYFILIKAKTLLTLLKQNPNHSSQKLKENTFIQIFENFRLCERTKIKLLKYFFLIQQQCKLRSSQDETSVLLLRASPPLEQGSKRIPRGEKKKKSGTRLNQSCNQQPLFLPLC